MPLLGCGERIYATYASSIRVIGESFQGQVEGEQSPVLGVRGAERRVTAARRPIIKLAPTEVLIDRLDPRI